MVRGRHCYARSWVTPNSSKAPPILILIGAASTGPLAMNLFVPSIPGLTRYFETDFATAQLTLTLFLVGIALGQLIYGPISDRYGRRPALLVGLAIYVAASLLAVYAWRIEVLILARVLQAIGGCAGMVLGRAIVRDVYPRDRSASVLAYIMMAMAVAPAIGPSLGGLLDGWYGWHAGFWVVSAFGASVLIFTLVMLDETNSSPIDRIDVRGLISIYGSLLRSPVFMGYTLNTACTIAAFFAFLAGAPYVMIEILGHPPVVYGLYFGLISVAYILGNFVAGRISTRLGIDKMVLLGVGLAFLGAGFGLILSMIDVVTAWAIFVPFCAVAIGNGISQANGVAGAIAVDQRIAGSAAGLLGFLQMLVAGVATVAVGYFQNESSNHASAATSFAAIIAALLAYALARAGQRRAAMDR
ncbi:MAG: multidrug effflux MFS transporter [Rhodospirillaceae bacterium]|nr:multidrug effflux MFS transporter [Rhodospirillaceae bacterium]